MIDAKSQSLFANGIKWCDGQPLTEPSAVKTWFSQRRAALQAQLATLKDRLRDGLGDRLEVLMDTEGYAHRAYDVVREDGNGVFMLVRPDGYVGLATSGDSVDHVHDYLKQMV